MPESEARTCEVCEAPLVLSWTARAKLAQCTRCGTGYWCEPGAPAEIDLAPQYVEWCREYWQEHRQPMPSGAFALLDGRHEVATREHFDTFFTWLLAKADAAAAAPVETR